MACIDLAAPVLSASINGTLLEVFVEDDLSGVAGVQVNSMLFTTLTNGALHVELDENMNRFEKLAVRAFDYAGNFSEPVSLDNPHYHGFSGQLQCAINRIYALDKPKKLKKAALILSSGSDHVYGGAIYEYQNSFLNYLRLEDMGIYTAYDQQNQSPEKLEALYQFGRSLAPDAPAAPAPMPVPDFLAAFGSGEPVRQGSAAMAASGWYSQEALRITAELNNTYHTPEEIQDIFARLTGKPVNRTFGLFPPFYTDCGKNITLGQHVFINSGCRFQDQGGITIDDGALIGHNVVLATLNHGLNPEERHDLFPASIHIGKNAWLGANVTVLGGVTIGDNAVIAAGAVVTRNVPANTVAAGVPARVVRTL